VLAAPVDSAYDIAVHDLAKDVKARASDRLKTPQEEAEAERLRLEQLEAERLRRYLLASPEPVVLRRMSERHLTYLCVSAFCVTGRMQGGKLQLSGEETMASAEYLGDVEKAARPRRKAAALEVCELATRATASKETSAPRPSTLAHFPAQAAR
jgi:hypothetical protein